MPKNMASMGGGMQAKKILGVEGGHQKKSFKFCSDGICDNRELERRRRQRHRKRHWLGGDSNDRKLECQHWPIRAASGLSPTAASFATPRSLFPPVC